MDPPGSVSPPFVSLPPFHLPRRLLCRPYPPSPPLSFPSSSSVLPPPAPPSFAASLLGWVSLSLLSPRWSPFRIARGKKPANLSPPPPPPSLSLSLPARRGGGRRETKGWRESYFFSRAPRRRRDDDDFCDDDFAWKINSPPPAPLEAIE